jgi:DNA-binding MarR family transcriptional regulator
MTNNKHDQLSMQVLKKFRLIYGSVRQHFREVEQTCGVSGSQLWMLREIADSPDIGISELAQRMAIHQSTCSLLVEKLVSRKLVIKERNQEDQRRVGLRLNPATRDVLSKAPGPAEGLLPDALKGMPENVLESLDGALAELILHLQGGDASYAEKPLSDL